MRESDSRPQITPRSESSRTTRRSLTGEELRERFRNIPSFERSRTRGERDDDSPRSRQSFVNPFSRDGDANEGRSGSRFRQFHDREVPDSSTRRFDSSRRRGDDSPSNSRRYGIGGETLRRSDVERRSLSRDRLRERFRNIPDLDRSRRASDPRGNGRSRSTLSPLDRRVDSDRARIGSRLSAEKLREFAEEHRRGRVGKNGKLPLRVASRSESTKKRGSVLHERRSRQLKYGRRSHLENSLFGRKFGFDRQFKYSRRGDISRRLGLGRSIHMHGGWRHRRSYGRLSSTFISFHFGGWYPGPSLYPRWCWFPRWSSWVDWSWWNDPGYYYDPRPSIGRPDIYDPCDPWDPWAYPTWQPLPVVSAGTWVDVDPVPVDEGLDVQLLAVRFVDPGHPEKELGPRYRVFFRNNSPAAIERPFNVLLIAANGESVPSGDELTEAGVEVTKIDAGETQSVDIRLPFEANRMHQDEEGRRVPFSHLHVLVDSHRQIQETDETNNGTVLPVGEILAIDPAAFAAESDTLTAGSTVSIAGEGFGPEPGYVVVYVKDLELQAEIEGWYDLGVRIKLPELPIVEATEAELVVVRGDGAASNPLTVTLTPPSTPPVPELEE